MIPDHFYIKKPQTTIVIRDSNQIITLNKRFLT